MNGKMLIGNKIKVVESTDPALVNRAGVILDETKNLLMLSTDPVGKSVLIPKITSVFELEIKGKKVHIKGKDIIGTAQERIHKI